MTNRWIQGMTMFGMLLFAGWVPPLTSGAQTQSNLQVLTPSFNLMPWPSSVEAGSGRLRIDASFSVTRSGRTEPRLDRAVQR